MSDEFARVQEANADVRSGPHCFIQWKGTDVCMDVYCACGAQCHVDNDFAYRVRCPHCHTTWAVSPYVRLTQTTEPPDGACTIYMDPDEGFEAAV